MVKAAKRVIASRLQPGFLNCFSKPAEARLKEIITGPDLHRLKPVTVADVGLKPTNQTVIFRAISQLAEHGA